MNEIERDRVLSLLVDVVGLTDRPDLQLEASQLLSVVDRAVVPFQVRAMQRLQDVDDAARYRWLRSSLSVGEWNRLGHYGDEELDQKIDAAMKESRWK